MIDLMSIKNKLQTLINQNFFEYTECITSVGMAISKICNNCLCEKSFTQSVDSDIDTFINFIKNCLTQNRIIYLDLFTCSHCMLLFYDDESASHYYIFNSYQNLYTARIQRVALEDIYNIEFNNSNEIYRGLFGLDKPCQDMPPKYRKIIIKVYDTFLK